MLLLGSVRYFWLRLSENDSALGGRATALLLAASAALTRDSSDASRARFENARPHLMRRCERMTLEERRCPLTAATIDEVERCR
jgi:hypothetical protein